MKERKVFLKPAVMGLDLGDGSEIHFKWEYLKWSMVFHCVYSAQFFIVSLFGRKLWNYIEWHGILFILFKMVNGKLVVLHINEKGK